MTSENHIKKIEKEKLKLYEKGYIEGQRELKMIYEENKVENVINIIKGMNIKDKLKLGICLTTSDWANIL